MGWVRVMWVRVGLGSGYGLDGLWRSLGAGVERLFNTARDICHYRRGRIKSKTIEELILFLCTSRFDLDVQEAKEIAQDLLSDEIDAIREQTNEMPDNVDIEEISDTEE
ncbi:hypothetical protein N7476_004747 [Penicillium atrosanguineum]|uniref:Uncharacterized protein n=1 Tax=Penicillium atrosanguineum TaxID=1132637 RepID=A0A9W9U6Z1_9EURO|nr:hypothetical protein N7476_004747 [Penicillium atrosanguineum]